MTCDSKINLYNVVSSTDSYGRESISKPSMMKSTDFICGYKPNYHTMSATTTPCVTIV